MRKNELIKLLQEMDGNPEIVLWNGYVNDYMHIDKNIVPITLVKESKEFLLSHLKYNYSLHHKTFDIPKDIMIKLSIEATELHKKKNWDLPNSYVTEEEFELWYGKRKKVIYALNAKLRNKTSLGMNSSGDIQY